MHKAKENYYQNKYATQIKQNKIQKIAKNCKKANVHTIKQQQKQNT